jgi:hypothetical protein
MRRPQEASLYALAHQPVSMFLIALLAHEAELVVRSSRENCALQD